MAEPQDNNNGVTATKFELALSNVLGWSLDQIVFQPLAQSIILRQANTEVAENGVISCILNIYRERGGWGLIHGWFIYGSKHIVDILSYGLLRSLWGICIPTSLFDNKVIRNRICSFLGPILFYPMDTILVRTIQSGKSATSTIFNIYKNEGVSGFFKGLHYDTLGRLISGISNVIIGPIAVSYINRLNGLVKLVAQLSTQLALSGLTFPIFTLKRRAQATADWIPTNYQPKTEKLSVPGLWNGLVFHNSMFFLRYYLGNTSRGFILAVLLSFQRREVNAQ